MAPSTWINRHKMHSVKTTTTSNIWIDFDWNQQPSYSYPTAALQLSRLLVIIHWILDNEWAVPRSVCFQRPAPLSNQRKSHCSTGPAEMMLVSKIILFLAAVVGGSSGGGALKLTRRSKFHHRKSCGGRDSRVELQMQESNAGHCELCAVHDNEEFTSTQGGALQKGSFLGISLCIRI